MVTCRFKVGDIITGKPASNKVYGVTTSDAVMEVIKVFDEDDLGDIRVKVIDYYKDVGCIGLCFTVRSPLFDLFEEDFDGNV